MHSFILLIFPFTEAAPPGKEPSMVFLNHMTLLTGPEEFVCVIAGYPIPQIQWFHDDELITADERTRVENFPNGAQQMKLAVSTLTITGINETDSGSYRCTGVNSLGNASSVVELEVAESGGVQKRSIDDSIRSSLCDSETGRYSPGVVFCLFGEDPVGIGGVDLLLGAHKLELG